MPIKTSAKKYMRVTERKTAVNKRVKGVLKSTIRKTREAIAEKDSKGAMEKLRTAQAAIDKAAKKGVLKKNAAARKKSRLVKAIKNITTK